MACVNVGKGKKEDGEKEREREKNMIELLIPFDDDESHSGHYSFASRDDFLGMHNCPRPKEMRDEKGRER